MKYKFAVLFITMAGILLPAMAVINSSSAQTVEQKEQLFITKDNIKSIEGFGEYEKINPEYTSFYNASNLFDGKQNSYSFFSEYGPSGVDLELINPLEQRVCSVEIGVFNPQNTAFEFKLNDKTQSGFLSGTIIEGDLNPCVKDLSKIEMDFAGVNATGAKKWTTLSEVKLFTNDTVIIEPPVCEPGTHYDPVLKKCVPDDIVIPPTGNATHINIINSTATMDVIDSTLIINLDEDSELKTDLDEDELLNGNNGEDKEEKKEDEKK